MKLKRISTILLWVGLIFIFSGCNMPGNVIVKNGKSIYHIVISKSATKFEKLAADELQRYLKQISSVN